jgi:hypothetical protein
MSEVLRPFCDELIRVFGPLVDAARTPDTIVDLLADLGWDMSAAPQPLLDLATAGSALVDSIGDATDQPAVTNVVASIKKFFDALNTIAAAPDSAFPASIDVATFKQTIGRELIDYFVVDHLLRRSTRVAGLLQLAGIIRLINTPATATRNAYLKRVVTWSQIGSRLANPLSGLQDAYGWTTGAPQLAQLMADISGLLESYNLQLEFFRPDGALLSFLNEGAPPAADPLLGMQLAFDDKLGAPAGFATGARLALRPPTASRGTALTVLPYAAANVVQNIPLGESVSLGLRGNVDFTKGVAVTLAPGRPIDIQNGFLGGTATSAQKVELVLDLHPPAGEPDRVLLGTRDASHLSMRNARFTTGARFSGTTPDLFARLDLDNAQLVIKPAADGGDSFLTSLFGDNGVTANASLGVEISSATGAHFSGAGGLAIRIPTNARFGPLEISAITASVQPSTHGVDATIGADVRASLGPVNVAASDVGLRLHLGLTDPPSGNLGIADVAAGFKPPSGIGLSVDAKGVLSGGGFLYHDEARSLYAGAMQLSLQNLLTLKAFGLIATRMPDGSPGYSLIVFITAEDFRAIPLGFGFNLLGIGGMVAINRSFDQEVLRAGLKNDTLATLLFPRDPVGNAPALINALANAFPARRGSYLLGLLAKIGWFTPMLVLMDLALIMEFGARTRLLALGRVSAMLPSRDNDLVRLNLDALGVIDFDAKTAAIDAVLVDSRLVHKFAITGEGALRAGFGGGPDSTFVLCVGGLNPHFAAPANFPKLKRVTIALSSGNNPRLICEAYFAITANTLQFGARAYLFAGAGGFSVEGDIGYDVLVQFIPLHFLAEFHARLQLKRGSSCLFMLEVNGELEGPRPLRLSGKATFKIWFVHFSVRFDTTLVNGEPPPLPSAVNVRDELAKALTTPQSWTTQNANNAAHGVALRSLPNTSTTLVLDPLGQLAIKQQVVPLNTARDIDTFGGAPVAGDRRFTLGATLGTSTAALPKSSLAAAFAPSQFFDMNDDERLTAPSFETYEAGAVFGASGVKIDESAGARVGAALGYTTFIIDLDAGTSAPPPATSTYTLTADRLAQFARSGAAARALVRKVARARFANTASLAPATQPDPRWSIVPKTSGAAASVASATRTWSEYQGALKSLNRGKASWQLLPTYEVES